MSDFRALRAVLPIVLSTLAACGSPAYQWKGTPLEKPQPVPSISAPSTLGRDFSLDEATGRATLLFFGYTHCPDVCPTTLADARRIFQALGSLADQVLFVMVTVDPERDTLDRLQAYLERFDPRFIGLRPQGETMEALKRAFGVSATAEPSDDPRTYLVTHTARLFLIGPQGRWLASYAFGTPPEDIASDLKHLLERAP